MKKLLIIAVILLIGAGVGVGVYLSQHSAQRDAGIIRISGNFEVTQVPLSFRLPGWVQRRPVDEGDAVKTGQLIAQLDATELEQDAAQRQAAAEAADAALAELKAGSRPEEIAQSQAAADRAEAALAELLAGTRVQEIRSAEAAVQRATAEVELAQSDLNRMKETVKTGAVTRQQYDSAQTAYNVAVARRQEADEHLKLLREGARKEQIDQARAAAAEAKERLALVKKGPRQETIDQAAAKLKEAKEALAIARTRLGYGTLASPVSGMVLSKNVEAGEFVAAGTPIVTVADLGDIWLRGYVDEPDLGRVKVGQKVKLNTDSYPGKDYDGRISFISSEAEFTPKTVQTAKERVKLVYRVKIVVENPRMELKPGMPGDARIIIGG